LGIRSVLNDFNSLADFSRGLAKEVGCALMRFVIVRGNLAFALLLIAPQAAAVLPAATAGAMAQGRRCRKRSRNIAASSGNIRKRARRSSRRPRAYWNSIAEKRRGRNAKRRDRQAIALDDYVLTQAAGLCRTEAAGGPVAIGA